MKKTLPNFWILVFTFILFVIHFCLIKCSYDVIHLFILVIYDVQYVANAYGFKINWISIFVNHKWIAHVLNTLVFLFLRVLFKNMHGFINLLFKLSIYIFSSRFKKILKLENYIFSFFKKYFKDWNIFFAWVWRYCCGNG